MIKFSELAIAPKAQNFIGNKIEVYQILNREITVHHFEIGESIFKEKGSGKLLTIQISLGSEKRIVFTGSTVLMDMIQKVPTEKFPFSTTIVKLDQRFLFT